MPLYALGLMGVTRRLSQFPDTTLSSYFNIAAVGALFIMAGIAAFCIQMYVSYRKRDELRDDSGDPWDGRTLEWSTSSPPPQYNFAFTPQVYNFDTWWDMKQRGYVRPLDGFKPIHMPKNTGAGFILAMICTLMAFALIWQIWWLAAGSFFTVIVGAIIHTFNYDREFYIPVEQVEAVEAERSKQLAKGRLA